MGHFRLQKLFIKDLLVMETSVSRLSRFLVKILILPGSHEIVPFASSRTHNGQMIIENNKTMLQFNICEILMR